MTQHEVLNFNIQSNTRNEYSPAEPIITGSDTRKHYMFIHREITTSIS